jgi:hypothetical protein
MQERVFQLERTSLHYAMGMEKVETLSNILIKAGAKRVLKDLVSNSTTKSIAALGDDGYVIYEYVFVCLNSAG